MFVSWLNVIGYLSLEATAKLFSHDEAHLPLAKGLPPLPTEINENSNIIFYNENDNFNINEKNTQHQHENKGTKLNDYNITKNSFIFNKYAQPSQDWTTWDSSHGAPGLGSFICPIGFTFLESQNICISEQFSRPVEVCPLGAFKDNLNGHCQHFDAVAPERVCPAGFEPFVRGCIRIKTVKPVLSCAPGYVLYDGYCWSLVKLSAQKSCPAEFGLKEIPAEYLEFDPDNPTKNINLINSYDFKLSLENKEITDLNNKNDKEKIDQKKTTTTAIERIESVEIEDIETEKNASHVNDKKVLKEESEILKVNKTFESNSKTNNSLNKNDEKSSILIKNVEHSLQKSVESDTSANELRVTQKSPSNNDRRTKKEHLKETYEQDNALSSETTDKEVDMDNKNTGLLRNLIKKMSKMFFTSEDNSLSAVIGDITDDDTLTNHYFGIIQSIHAPIDLESYSDLTTHFDTSTKFEPELKISEIDKKILINQEQNFENKKCVKELSFLPNYKCDDDHSLVFFNSILSEPTEENNFIELLNKTIKNTIIISKDQQRFEKLSKYEPICISHQNVTPEYSCEEHEELVQSQDYSTNELPTKYSKLAKPMTLCLHKDDITGKVVCSKGYQLRKINEKSAKLDIENWGCYKINDKKVVKKPQVKFPKTMPCKSNQVHYKLGRMQELVPVCKNNLFTEAKVFCKENRELYCVGLSQLPSELFEGNILKSEIYMNNISENRRYYKWSEEHIAKCHELGGESFCLNIKDKSSLNPVCPPNTSLVQKGFNTPGPLFNTKFTDICQLSELTDVILTCPLGSTPNHEDGNCNVVERTEPKYTCPSGFTKTSSNNYNAYPNTSSLSKKNILHSPTILLPIEPEICEFVAYTDLIITCPEGYRKNSSFHNSHSCVAEKKVDSTFVCPPSFIFNENASDLELTNDKACKKTVVVAPSIVSGRAEHVKTNNNTASFSEDVQACQLTQDGELSCGANRKFMGSRNYLEDIEKAAEKLEKKRNHQMKLSIKRSPIPVPDELNNSLIYPENL